MTSAVVADDEINLLNHMVRLLGQAWPDLDIVATATNGDAAQQLIQQHKPDIAFLDIRMPGLNGLQVAQQTPSSTQIVFITAHEEFAVKAFERAAIDYVLKPATIARIEQTVARLRDHLGGNKIRDFSQPLIDELLGKLAITQRTSYLQWLRTGNDTQTQLIAVDDVVYITAKNKYTTVFTTDREHLVRTSINDLSEALNPTQFWQIHRSIIVKVSEIQEARRDIRGRYTLTLKSLSTKLRSSQRYGHLFKLS